MDEGEEGSAPRLDEHEVAVGSKHGPHFREGVIEIVRQRGKMVQAALDDEDVFAAIGEGKFPAICDGAFRGAFELSDEAWREVYSFDAGEAKTIESDQAISAAAKKFDDFGIARPLPSAQSSEARGKLLQFRFWRLE